MKNPLRAFGGGIAVAISLVSLASIENCQAQLSDGLVNYWTFDDTLVDVAPALPGSSSTVNDDGTFIGANGTGGIAFGTGLFGNAIEQDGAAGAAQNNGCVEVIRSDDTLFGLNATNPAAPNTVTTSMWVETAGLDTSWQTLLSHGEGSQYRMARRDSSNPPIASYAGGSGDIPGDNATGPPIGVNNGFHHVVAISDGILGETRLYVDNMLVATGGAPAIDDARGGGTLNLNIGANPDTGGQNREWFGKIDDVAQWNRVLTVEEIDEIYTAGSVDGDSLGTVILSQADEKIFVSSTLNGIDFLSIDIKDVGASVLDPGTITVIVEGVDVTAGATVTKDGDTTTIRHDEDPQWTFSTEINYELMAQDGLGQSLDVESSFTTQDPEITVDTGLRHVEFTVTDVGASVLQPETIAVQINGSDVTPGLTVSKVGAVTTIRHDEVPQFDFGTTVTYALTSMDNFGQDLNLAGSFDISNPLFPIGEDLIGAEDEVAAGFFGTRYIFNAGTIDSFNSAITTIQAAESDPGFLGTVVDVQESEINHSDNGTRGLIQPDLPYNADAVAQGCCLEDFIMYAVGYMRIDEAGDYTVGVHSDDGFGCRIQGFNFTSINAPDGNRMIDPSSPDTFAFVGNTGDSNTRAVASNVQPGIYRVEFFWWERGGGDHGEIYIARGAFLNDGDTTVGGAPDQWKLIGGPLGGDFYVPGFSSDGVDVLSLGPNLVEDPTSAGLADFDRVLNPNGAGEDGLTNIAEVQLALDNPALIPGMSNHDFINFNDPQSGGPGRIPGDIPFPNDTPADDNDFLIEFSGTLVIPENGTYHIGFQGDDGSFLRIPGQEFTSLIENATNNSVIDEGGARIICDFPTGNSSTVGEITLAAGNYPVEGQFFERGGGAYLEVFGIEAGGPQLLIEKDGARFATGVGGGQPLVDPPGRDSFRITDFVFDPGTGDFSITWNSKEGEFYRITYEIGAMGAPNASPWDIDIDDGYPADVGETTTFIFNLLDLDAAAQASPRIYFRIEEVSD